MSQEEEEEQQQKEPTPNFLGPKHFQDPKIVFVKLQPDLEPNQNELEQT